MSVLLAVYGAELFEDAEPGAQVASISAPEPSARRKVYPLTCVMKQGRFSPWDLALIEDEDELGMRCCQLYAAFQPEKAKTG